MKTSRLPMTLFCIIAFVAFEIGVGQEAVSLADALGWTLINAIGCIGLWLFADAHLEIGDLELGDLLATGYHPLDPRHPRNRNDDVTVFTYAACDDDWADAATVTVTITADNDAPNNKLYPQVVMDTVGRNLIMLHSSEDCYASPFSEN